MTDAKFRTFQDRQDELEKTAAGGMGAAWQGVKTFSGKLGKRLSDAYKTTAPKVTEGVKNAMPKVKEVASKGLDFAKKNKKAVGVAAGAGGIAGVGLGRATKSQFVKNDSK